MLRRALRSRPLLAAAVPSSLCYHHSASCASGAPTVPATPPEDGDPMEKAKQLVADAAVAVDKAAAAIVSTLGLDFTDEDTKRELEEGPARYAAYLRRATLPARGVRVSVVSPRLHR